MSQRQANEAPAPPSHEREIEARPTGLPNSDRHATETAHFWEDEEPEAPENEAEPDNEAAP